MQKNVFCLITLLLTCYGVIAQKQANIWHFGDGRCLDFSSGEPIQVTGSQLITFEGSASYCDEHGNLQLYTNGGGRETPCPLLGSVLFTDKGSIWDRNNNVMYDMMGTKGGGYSSSQSSVIFEFPGQDSVYYVFTMDEMEYMICSTPATMAAQPNGRGLSYFVVDMRLNGGLGSVVLADQRVYAPAQEALCAIRHANGEDYWLVINSDSSGIASYGVTATGVSLADTASLLSRNGNNQIKASPDGRFLSAFFFDFITLTSRAFLFEFDNSTGQLSNPIGLPADVAGIEFSPNSRYLFALKPNAAGTIDVVQYDLQATVLFSSSNLVGSIDNSFGAMQLGPDGKIYNLSRDPALNRNIMNRINCPNTTTPSLQQGLFNFQLGFDTIFLNLPNFPACLFENYDSSYVALGPDTVQLCQFSGSYTLNAMNPGATYLWSTGATTQTITVTSPGTYSVTVDGPCGPGSDEVVIVNCIPCTPVNSSQNANACNTYTAPWGAVYTQSGVYTDTIFAGNGCDTIITLNLTINSSPSVSASAVGESCSAGNGSATAIASGGSGPYLYAWSNGLAGSTISGLSSGTYTVSVNDANGCTATAQVTVNNTPASGVNLVAGDTVIDLNESVNISIEGGSSYAWSPTDGLSCADCPSVTASPQSTTLYTVSGLDSSGCPYTRRINILIEIVCKELFVPDIFSPNGTGDPENEKFCIYSNCKQSMNLAIYNRWGELIFTTNNPEDCWDGMHQGSPVLPGVYTYRLSVDQKDGLRVERSGSITLVR